jgi:hypothetical protein
MNTLEQTAANGKYDTKTKMCYYKKWFYTYTHSINIYQTASFQPGTYVLQTSP